MDLMKIRPPRSVPIPNSDKESSYQWHPGFDLDAMMRVSKSSHNAFGFCQHQYFIKYVLGVKEPPNDAMTRGSNVHDAIDDWYANFDLDHAIKLKAKGYQAVLEWFLSLMPESNSERGDFELDEQEHLRKIMVVEARRFMDSDSKYFLPVGNEVPLNAIIQIKGVTVHLNGIVDRLFEDSEGNLHIHELKTGKWKESKFKWEGMREEMAFYAYLIKHCNHEEFGGRDALFWGWDFTGGNDLFRGREPVRVQEIQSMLKRLNELVSTHIQYDGLQHGRQFDLISPYRQKTVCEPWCKLKGFCPRFGEVMKFE